MLPSTCILPSQRQRIDAKLAEKAQIFAVERRHVYAELKRLEDPAGYLSIDRLRLPGSSVALCGCVNSLSLNSCSLHDLRLPVFLVCPPSASTFCGYDGFDVISILLQWMTGFCSKVKQERFYLTKNYKPH